ncbi:MAG: hypothetical protein ACR2LI_15060 [Propionibacteriaceae bacterium]
MPRLFALLRLPRRRAVRSDWSADDLQVLFETNSPTLPAVAGTETPEARALVAGALGAHLR